MKGFFQEMLFKREHFSVLTQIHNKATKNLIMVPDNIMKGSLLWKRSHHV